MYNELEVIQPIINWHKIKYKTFSKLIMNSRMEGNKVNMFINLDSILNLFYTDKLIPAVHSLKHLENIGQELYGDYATSLLNTYFQGTKIPFEPCSRL